MSVLPVWTYWEGECPPWIVACRETLLAHADARLLGPDDVSQLLGGERAVDLSRLHVAHRADYIRAMLLARFGGLWVDADCVVMQDLERALLILTHHDFFGHFERQGRISNAFIGSRPGGRIATAYFERVHATVTSESPLTWLSLGSMALTDVLNETGAPWFRMNVELVQPICWSNPAEFFRHGSPAEHEQRLNPRSLCYMLSANTVGRYLGENPGADLMSEATFFSYLVARSRQHPISSTTTGSTRPAILSREPHHARGTSMNRPTGMLMPFCLQAVEDLQPELVLDLDVGIGRWALLIHEICDDGASRLHRENWRTRVHAVVATPAVVEEYHHFLYDWVHVGDPTDGLPGDQTWDLVIAGNLTESVLQVDREAALSSYLSQGTYLLLLTQLADEGQPGTTASSFLSLSPVRHELVEFEGRWYGAFLLSHADPKHLRRDRETTDLFSRIFRDNLWQETSSRSGPGSGLIQTSVIRTALPALLNEWGVRSMLDLPCGDFNWMRHVDLPVDQYIGADIVPEITARNRLEFGSDFRTFVTLDARTATIPRVDLILCRDGLVHLSFEDAMLTLANFKRSGATYLLATTFPDHLTNTPIATGEWRPLNLERPPFSLPEPTVVLNEGCTEGNGQYVDKSLALWLLADL